MTTPAHRYQKRDRLIDNDDISTGIHTNEDHCARFKKHIEKMKLLGGDHLYDIESYKNLMMQHGCKNIPSGGSRRRRASKHSKKHRKSKKSRKSKKTKSRRH
jgi:hypothetical protein